MWPPLRPALRSRARTGTGPHPRSGRHAPSACALGSLPELVEAGDLLRLDGPGLLVALLRDDEAILVYDVDLTTRHSGERTTTRHHGVTARTV